MVRVKICGITNEKDAMFAIEHGADALGFVFYEKSPRHITPEKASEIIKKLPPFITNVGLFVNERQNIVKEIHERLRLDALQFHGDEKSDYVNSFHAKKIKAFRIKESIDETIFNDYDVDAYLFDAYSDNVYGGSGENFSWNLLTKIRFKRPIILAGGLNPENIISAVSMVKPYAVDVSSGVEKEKGIKDSDKVKKFIIRAKHERIEK